MAKPKYTLDDGTVTVVEVEKGDTLWDIAEKYLGSGTKNKVLSAINGIVNPDLIHPGQEVALSKDAAEPEVDNGPKSVTIKQFGLVSTDDTTLFATWTWGRENKTDSYKVVWTYTTEKGVTLIGNSSNITVDKDYYAASRQSTYSIPSNAVKVTFKVKPIAKTEKKNNTETKSFEAEWSEVKEHIVAVKVDTPPQPSVKFEDGKLTAELENLDIDATAIQFRLVKDDINLVEIKTVNINNNTFKVSKYVSYVWPAVDPGCEYKVACRAAKNDLYSEWSNYSSNVSTPPATPSGITTCKAINETKAYLEWSAVKTATDYVIEYTNNKEYFDTSNEVTSVTVSGSTKYYLTNMVSGKEYFFRVQAKNNAGESEWTDIVSIILGKSPAAPTTWSSTTTAIVGETVNLYWVHNSEDGSSETFAELELYVNDTLIPMDPIQNTDEGDNVDATKFYAFNTSSYAEGTTLRWRVRTRGIASAYGDWSIQRTVDIYAQPSVRLGITDQNGSTLSAIASFPFYISAIPGPKTQSPIGYHISVTSNEVYETVDAIGNPVMVNIGEEVYSKYFDTNYDLVAVMTAGSIDLEKNVSYTFTCTVTMNSGLTAENSVVLPVTWSETLYTPNASIGIDPETYSAYITPYCEDRKMVYRQVNYVSGDYVRTDTVLDYAWGEPVQGAYTMTDEQVYRGVNGDGTEVYFCQVEESTVVEDVLLSVYRREFDGTFTEIATDLDNSRNVTVTDPHPALDYARYRIVATSMRTGAVGYYDMPGYPVKGKAVIIQWNEEWSNFEASGEDPLEQPPWSGSLLKLPYNIDVSDSHNPDVSMIDYIGRAHPVSYYGTHLGETSTWTVDIDKNDKETLYALRRLAIWMGDAYVREPSGSGYWAHINVGFSQKHCETSVPVTLNITRVEGGV